VTEKSHNSSTDVAVGDGILRNAGALLAARYVVAGLGWAGTVLIVRTLTVAEWGRFSFVFTFLGLLSIVTDLQIGRVAVRGLVDPERDVARFGGAYVTLRTALGAMGYAVAVGFVALAGYPGEVVRATAVAGVVVLLSTPSDALNAVFFAHMRAGTVAVGQILGQLVQFALTAAIAASGDASVVVFALPALAFDAVALGWKLARVGRVQRLRYGVRWEIWRELLREAAPLALAGGLMSVYFRIDTVLLSRLDSFTSVGVYGVAYKFVEMVRYAGQAITVPLLTLMVRSWPDDLPQFRDVFRRGVVLAGLLGALVAAEFAVFAEEVIELLYGSRYARGADAARLLVGGQCLGIVGLVAVTALVAAGRHRAYSAVALAAVVVNTALNLLLIPAWSYEGAAVATAVTDVLLVVVLFHVAGRSGGTVPAGAAWRVAGAGLVTWVVATALAGPLPWPAAAAMSAAVYAVVVQFGGVLEAAGLRIGWRR
jgi:O-antigen/teichoic acid export membrane protein